MAFEPSAAIRQFSETGRMALGKAILPKAFQLLEDLFGKLFVVALLLHAFKQTLPETLHTAPASPSGHGTTQFVRLIGRETRRHHSNLHGLFLEDGNAKGAGQYLIQFRRRAFRILLALAPAQVGMDHAALDRPRAYDGHLNHQIVEMPRLHA